jgi:hypothetical protein
MRAFEVFAAPAVDPPFAEVCPGAISNQADIGNKHTRR